MRPPLACIVLATALPGCVEGDSESAVASDTNEASLPGAACECWPVGKDPTVQVNGAIDLGLGPVPGPYQGDVESAIDQWNAELAVLGACIRIGKGGPTVNFAAEQGGGAQCTPVIWEAATKPVDDVNTVSTCESTNPGTDPGWCYRSLGGESSQSVDLLAYTVCRPPPPGSAKHQEADIAWLTHEPFCPQWDWDYNGGHIVFEHVMLHEIGHLLGLVHINAGAGGMVMQPTYGPHTGVIGPKERADLRKLYDPMTGLCPCPPET